MRGRIRTGPSPQALHRTPIRLLERLLDSHSACALAASQAGLVAKEGGLIINGRPRGLQLSVCNAGYLG
ncbi:unnamed protein product [Ectocarpus sp. CCAP 1310/34]|nr:unnamed protein product [Ectocarpus sp. CCAP 1310/34]